MLTMVLDNGTISIGKDAVQNWKIIDSANPEDYWFHIANCSSCHVIFSCNDKDYKLSCRALIIGIIELKFNKHLKYWGKKLLS